MLIIKTASYTKLAAWGKAGAGILFTCHEDGTAMLLFRSGPVLDPYMWGVPGGAVQGTEGHYDDNNAGGVNEFGDDELWNTARGETVQELYGVNEHDFDSHHMFPQNHQRHPQKVVFDTNPNNPNSFKYYTFVVDIPVVEKKQMEQNATLNWENDKMEWFPIDVLLKHVTPVKGNHSYLNNGDRLHKGVSHVLKTHPAFKEKPARQPRRPRKGPPVDPNQQELF